jgi:thiamine biosynthesis lipoprotein
MSTFWRISLALMMAARLQAAELTTRTQMMMGTLISFSLPVDRPEAFAAGFGQMRAVEQALSSYDPKAEIYRLNETGHAVLSELTLEALAHAARYYHQSGGVFNPAIGAVTLEAFRFGRSDARVPEAAQLDRADVRFSALKIEGPKAHLEAGVQLDLGGMGKGFAVDKSVAVLRQMGLKRGVVAASGDIRCLHRCTLAVEDPFSGGELLRFQAPEPDWGISTSGDYRRHVKIRAHNHLIGTDRRPQRTFASITLTGRAKSSDLDAWATTVAVMPLKEAIAFAKTLPVDYLLIETDGRVHASALFEKLPAQIQKPADEPQ